MSLFKQLAIMLTLFLGIILVSVMMLNFKSATEFVQNQLYTDAKNTAHSLGLSLSKVADPSDKATMETMINAIFDSGYYERIALNGIDGNTIYLRENDVVVRDVPQWFIDSVSIHNVTVKSDIMIGWNRFGTLEVSGHTGHAYRQLYLTFVDLIETFVLIGALVFGVLYLLLSLSLKALERIKKQATAIIDNEFIIEQKIPFTTEFRSVTQAMNAMVSKVKDIFDRENETLRRYQELLYKDTETHLYNRRYLTAKLPDYLLGDTPLSSGAYAMFSFEELERFKREMGYETYNRFMREFADEMEGTFVGLRNVLIARLNESDFIVIVPSVGVAEVQARVEKELERTGSHVEMLDAQVAGYLNVGGGVGSYNANDTLKSLFSRADHTVTRAKDRGRFAAVADESADDTLVLGHEEWRNELLKSIEESRMVLAFQSAVVYTDEGMKVMHEEILLRLLDREGTIHSAGYFIPVATSLGLVDTLDRYMIGKVLSHLREKYTSVSMAINLSCDFITKQSNRDWLRGELEDFRRQNRTQLWFEVSNAVALNEPEAVQILSSMLKQQGHRFGIDHFVLPERGAEYLQAIRPDYVKSNGTYLQDMLYDKDTGHVRESFNNLTKSMGIDVIAINIEDAKQMEELKALGITRFQGSYIAPVTLLK
ncbi:MAG: EAL domain-containing protein [Campylobacterales bacterium]|nr:EAL domain-containing protein [Campylobacterales bacterium]